MSDKAPETSEISAASEANKELGDVKVLIKEQKKMLGGLIKIPIKKERHLLSTDEGTNVLNRYESDLKDGLTGLLKRNVWMDEAKRFYEYSLRNGKIFGILYIDINDFKPYNDKISHGFGDEVIKLVANAVQESTRDSDVSGRVGGDELAVALPDADRETLMYVRERINSKLSELSSGSELMLRHGVNPTVTIGSSDSSDQFNFKNILDAADRNMLELKKQNNHGR